MDQYVKLEKIGEGTYGKVYKAKEKNTGRLVALKKTRLEMEEEGVPSTALREVSLLQMLNESNHVVKLLCVQHVEENKKPVLYLVFEYLSTDLKKFMDRNGKGPSHPLDPKLIKSFMYQLIKGVAHCHKHGVMHRDLKPQNLLVDDETECLKIADLGLGRAYSVPIKSYTHEIVTLWYRAPEVLLGATHYAPAVDMWSVGCIFAELVTKMLLFPGDCELRQLLQMFKLPGTPKEDKWVPLFPGDCELRQLLHIFKLLGTPKEDEWAGVSQLRDWHEFPNWRPQSLEEHFPALEPAGVDLMRELFIYDPAKRVTAKEAIKHAYFDDLDKAEVDLLESESIRAREA